MKYRVKKRTENARQAVQRYIRQNQITVLTDINIVSNDVDIKEMRESLKRIEKTYYSSNIRLERIKRKTPSEIILSKLPRKHQKRRHKSPKLNFEES